MALDTAPPWDILGALPETFITAAAPSSRSRSRPRRRCSCAAPRRRWAWRASELARAAGVRVVATTRAEARVPGLLEGGAAAVVLEGPGFAERRALRSCPEVPTAQSTLIGGRAVLDSLQVVRRGGTVCNSGLLGGEWVIDDFQPIENIPSARKLTAYHSDEGGRRERRRAAAGEP